MDWYENKDFIREFGNKSGWGIGYFRITLCIMTTSQMEEKGKSFDRSKVAHEK